jgi:hypothetical protein
LSEAFEALTLRTLAAPILRPCLCQLLGDIIVLKAPAGSSTICALRQADAGALWITPVSSAFASANLSAQSPGNSQLHAPMQIEVEHWGRAMQPMSLKSETPCYRV